MKEKIQRFMYGRYGIDDLNHFLMYVAFVLLILGFFIRSSLYNFLVFLIIAIYYCRMMSKNHPKRYSENQKFLEIKARIVQPIQRYRMKKVRNKGYRIFTCPSCKQKVRVPKGKGKINIMCPKCMTEFIKRT
jgi:uncharacterized membrane-anchored protein YitT (DUF2179 family)